MKALAVLVGVAFFGCWNQGVKGSGKSKSEVRAVAPFTAVEVSGALDIDVVIAAEPRVEITGDDNLVPLIDTQVSGGRLEASRRENVRPVVPLVIHVAAPRITAVTASGASSLALHGVHGDQLAVTARDASTVRGDGSVQQLTAEASGASKLDIDQLAAERARVIAAGASTVSTQATRALDVEASSASTVKYRGNPPDLKQDLSGASSLVKR